MRSLSRWFSYHGAGILSSSLLSIVVITGSWKLWSGHSRHHPDGGPGLEVVTHVVRNEGAPLAGADMAPRRGGAIPGHANWRSCIGPFIKAGRHAHLETVAHERILRTALRGVFARRVRDERPAACARRGTSSPGRVVCRQSSLVPDRSRCRRPHFCCSTFPSSQGCMSGSGERKESLRSGRA